MKPSKDPWFADGLRFDCTQCGDCCTGAPGFVWVDRDEVRRLAELVGLSTAEFRRRFTRSAKNRVSLVEKPNGDCIFYEQGCSVYEARPRQCRTYPFWPENLRSAKTWAQVQEDCPGCGQGRVFPMEEIQLIRRGEAEARSD